MNYQTVFDQTKQILMDYLRVNEEEITPDTHLVNDLIADSIALVELGFRLAETFNIPMPQPTDELYIMKNLVQFLTDQINAA
ncbi:MAG: acyl carrier protein [Firmicutes bacterium]|nr:acyl carrier protein [Bacillota bacterium]